VIGLVVFAALLTVLALVGRPGFLQPWLLPLAVAAVASAAVEVAVVLPRRHRRYRYRIVEGSVIVETGVTFFRQLVVPARHVLFVEINRGPVLRALGLAKVQLGTIADAKSVGPLTQATAEELRGEIETAAGVR
jgi:membrane protein YdbS with pleckstrin-like domain